MIQGKVLQVTDLSWKANGDVEVSLSGYVSLICSLATAPKLGEYVRLTFEWGDDYNVDIVQPEGQEMSGRKWRRLGGALYANGNGYKAVIYEESAVLVTIYRHDTWVVERPFDTLAAAKRWAETNYLKVK
jgi:hypothetical protein